MIRTNVTGVVMSWGERSCVKPCRAPKGYPKHGTCTVDCPDYQWDGIKEPDTVSRPKQSNVGQSTSTNIPITQGPRPNRAERRKAARLRNR